MGGNLGKVLTLDQLQKRGWSLVNRCFLCKEEKGFIDHILLHCSLVRVLGQLLFDLLGIHWVLVAIVKETLLR